MNFRKNVNKVFFFLFLFLIFFLPWEKIVFISVYNIDIRPYQFILFVLYFFLGLNYLLNKKKIKFKEVFWKLKQKKIDLFLVLFFLASFLSVVNAFNKKLALKQSLILIILGSIYWLTSYFINQKNKLKAAIKWFYFSILGVIVYGIWQNWQFMHGYQHYETMPGRPNASFVEADWLGIFLALTLSVEYLVFLVFLSQNKLGQKKYFYHFLNLFLIELTLILLILTVSRSAWLGAVGTTFCFFLFLIYLAFKKILINFKKLLYSSLILAGLFLLSLFLIKIIPLSKFEFKNRLQSTQSGWQEITISCNKNKYQSFQELKKKLPLKINDLDELKKYQCHFIKLEEIASEKRKGNYIAKVYRSDPNFNIRQKIYKKSFQEIKKHFILGIGWGNISLVLGKDSLGNNLNASNIFLEVWLGSGLLGLVSFLAILINIFQKGGEYFFIGVKQKDNFLILWGIFLCLSLLAFFVPNLFNSGIMLGFFWLWLGIVSLDFFVLQKN